MMDSDGAGKAGEGRGQAVVRQVGVVQMGGETGGVSRLPVFLSPPELVFYSGNMRRVLTVFNPYSFSLSFKMLCTAPSLYRVLVSEGTVGAKSCVELVVRHLDVSPRHWGRRDRFRLEVRGGGQEGGREIWAELRGGGEGGRGRTLSAQTPLSPLLVPTHTHLQLSTCTAVHSVSQWVVCVVLALLCVAVLMLPLHTDSSSVVPRCLHVSTNQKLVCAYTLGLLTVVFLR